MNESNIEFCLMITELREKFSFKIKWKKRNDHKSVVQKWKNYVFKKLTEKHINFKYPDVWVVQFFS